MKFIIPFCCVLFLSGCANFVGPGTTTALQSEALSGISVDVQTECEKLENMKSKIDGKPIGFATVDDVLIRAVKEHGFMLSSNADFRLTFNCQRSPYPSKIPWFIQGGLMVFAGIIPIPWTQDFILSLKVEDLREGDPQVIDEQESMGPSTLTVTWLPFAIGNIFTGIYPPVSDYEEALKNTAHSVLNESIEGYVFD